MMTMRNSSIFIQLRREDGFFFATNDTLSLCGTGTSWEEAMIDFTQHLTHFYNYYKKMPESSLTGAALKLKTLYLNLFIEGD